MMQVTANAPRPVAIASALFMKPLMGSPGKRRTLGKWPSTALNPTSMSGCTGGALTTMRRFRIFSHLRPLRPARYLRLVVLVLVLVRHHGRCGLKNPALGAANPLVAGRRNDLLNGGLGLVWQVRAGLAQRSFELVEAVNH